MKPSEDIYIVRRGHWSKNHVKYKDDMLLMSKAIFQVEMASHYFSAVSIYPDIAFEYSPSVDCSSS